MSRKASAAEISQAIKNTLRSRIESGELAEGTRIPSELSLARELRVTRAQAREALVELELEGYIFRYRGRGSFVAPADHRIKHLGIRGYRIVAMSCNTMSSHYKRTVIEGFSTTLHEHGVQAMIYFLDPSEDSEMRFIQGIRTSGVEGLALWLRRRSETTMRILETFQESRFPFVLCDRYVPGFEADYATSDNEAIGYDLTRRLLARGHRRIAFMSLWMGITPAQDRLAGYRRALEEAGAQWDPALVGSFDTPEDLPPALIKDLMAQRSRPTAMLCVDDRVARRAVEILRQLGFRLPKEMEIATVDDDREVQNLGVPVITLEQNGREVGRQTAELLLARMSNPDKAAEQRIVPFLERPEPADSFVKTGVFARGIA